MSSPSEFKTKMTPWAMVASVGTGIPHQVILAQWSLESTYGTSSLAQRAKNFGGIKYHGGSYGDYQDGSYAGYNSLMGFVKDYIKFMQQPRYSEVRSASGIKDTVQALGRSGYAEDTSYTDKIMSVIGNRVGTTGGFFIDLLKNPTVWLIILGAWLLFRD